MDDGPRARCQDGSRFARHPPYRLAVRRAQFGRQSVARDSCRWQFRSVGSAALLVCCNGCQRRWDRCDAVLFVQRRVRRQTGRCEGRRCRRNCVGRCNPVSAGLQSRQAPETRDGRFHHLSVGGIRRNARRCAQSGRYILGQGKRFARCVQRCSCRCCRDTPHRNPLRGRADVARIGWFAWIGSMGFWRW